MNNIQFDVQRYKKIYKNMDKIWVFIIYLVLVVIINLVMLVKRNYLEYSLTKTQMIDLLLGNRKAVACNKFFLLIVGLAETAT